LSLGDLLKILGLIVRLKVYRKVICDGTA